MKKEGLENLQIVSFFMAVLVQLNDEKPRLRFLWLTSNSFSRGCFQAWPWGASGASSWACRAGLAATSIFDMMPLEKQTVGKFKCGDVC